MPKHSPLRAALQRALAASPAPDRRRARCRHRHRPAHPGRRADQSGTFLRTGQFLRVGNLSRHEVGRDHAADQPGLRTVRQTRCADRRRPGRRRDGDYPAQGRPAGNPFGDRDRVSERAGAAAPDPDPRRTDRRHRQDHATAAATGRGRCLVAGRDGPGRGRVRAGEGRPRACCALRCRVRGASWRS